MSVSPNFRRHRPALSRRLLRIILVVVVATFAFVTGQSSASAHAELVETTPTDGATLTDSLGSVHLLFSSEVRSAGDGIQLLDGSGSPVDGSVLFDPSGRVVFTPAEPLGRGGFRANWTVQSGDAHPISGTFVFSVVGRSGQPDDGNTLEPPSPVEQGSSGVLATVGYVGRLARMGGSLLGVGMLIYAGGAFVGSRREAQRAAYWVRRAGLVALVGVAVEAFSVAASTGLASFGTTALGTQGLAWAMAAGGAGALFVRSSLSAEQIQQPASRARAVAMGHGSAVSVGRPRFRLAVADSVGAIAGSVLVVGSFLLDGHTITASPRGLVWLADVVHVVAATVWIAGVLFMATTLADRHRRGAPLLATELVSRFSPLAAVSVGALFASGTLMTWLILDTADQLWTTAWGRTLAVKLALFGAAALLGAYNHWKMAPRLASERTNAVSRLFRTALTWEAAFLIGVVLVTAALVWASSSA